MPPVFAPRDDGESKRGVFLWKWQNKKSPPKPQSPNHFTKNKVHKLLQNRAQEEGDVSDIDRLPTNRGSLLMFIPAGARVNIFTVSSFSLIQITQGSFPGSFNTNSRCPLIRANFKALFCLTSDSASAARRDESRQGWEILGMTFKSMLQKTLRGFWGWITRRTKRIILLITCSANCEIQEGRKKEKEKDVRH